MRALFSLAAGRTREDSGAFLLFTCCERKAHKQLLPWATGHLKLAMLEQSCVHVHVHTHGLEKYPGIYLTSNYARWHTNSTPIV